MLGKILDKFETGLVIIWELLGLLAAIFGTVAMIMNLVAVSEASVVVTVLAAFVFGARIVVWIIIRFIGDPILASEHKEANAELFDIAAQTAIAMLLLIHAFAFAGALIKTIGG